MRRDVAQAAVHALERQRVAHISTAQTQRIFGGARILVRSDFWVTVKSALLLESWHLVTPKSDCSRKEG